MTTPTTISYTDLTSETVDLSRQLEAAFGKDSAGVIAIDGIPKFVEHKAKFLPKSHIISHLPALTLKSLESEKTLFNAGWSHGKEKLGDKPDLAKGSYYFNPLTDAPGSAEDRAKYPLSYPENIWPAPSDVPEFEEQAKALGSLMREVVVLLAKHIDRFAASFYPDYEADYLFNQMATTEKAKGRLLYYFPLSAAEIAEGVSEDSWIGWHNDSGFLTALAGDMYVDEATGEQVPCPDPEAGLYVTTRDGTSTKVNIPSECMAVQIGECVQIITGGKIVATPHCVKGAKVAGVGRISFPLFIDTAPNVELKMPLDCTRDDVFAAAIPNDKVPALDSRWKNGQSFGEFLDATFNVYYKK